MTANDGMGDPDALREEIRQTRADLGRTMQALATKANVKSRVREQAAQQKAHLREQAMHRKDELREQGLHRMERARSRFRQTARSARGSAQRAQGTARQHPRPLAGVAAGAVATVLVVLAVRRRRR